MIPFVGFMLSTQRELPFVRSGDWKLVLLQELFSVLTIFGTVHTMMVEQYEEDRHSENAQEGCSCGIWCVDSKVPPD